MGVSASVADLLEDLALSASAGVRVTVESNVAPAFEVYGGSAKDGSGAGRPSVLGMLGIRGGLVVRNARGDVLARVGQPAAFEPLRAVLILGAVLATGYLIVRVVRR